jgi:cell division protein FtsQ
VLRGVQDVPPDVTAIEPRRAAREAEARARRRQRVVLVTAGLVALCGGVWLVLHSPVLALRRVEVEGALRHTSPAQVRAHAGLRTGRPLLLVDLTAAARRVERLPWVAEARLERRLPGTVRIRVSERAPVAWAVDADGAPWLLDRTGRVLARLDAPPADLVEVRGVRAAARPGSVVRPARPARVLGELDPELARTVGRVELRRSGVVLVLRAAPDGSVPPVGEVRLGSVPDAVRQSAVATAVLSAMTDRAGFLDVSSPDAPFTGGSG